MTFFDLLFSAAQFILETTFKASILAILILLLQLPLRKKIPAKWLHALWLLVIIRMLLPFELESKISLYNLVPVKNNQESIEETVAFSIETPQVFETKFVEKEVPIIASAEFPETSKQVYKFLPIHYFSIFWLLGVIVFLRITVTNNLKFRNRIKVQRKIINKEILDLFYQCKKEMKVQSEIGLVEVDAAQVPLLYGIFRPRILLPVDFINRIDRDELRYIFFNRLSLRLVRISKRPSFDNVHEPARSITPNASRRLSGFMSKPLHNRSERLCPHQ